MAKAPCLKPSLESHSQGKIIFALDLQQKSSYVGPQTLKSESPWCVSDLIQLYVFNISCLGARKE